MKTISIILSLVLSILLISLSSALTVSDVDAQVLAPGQEGTLKITVKNTFSFDVEEVSLSLDLTNLPLTTVGSSEFSQEEIEEDDRETFTFRLRADSTAKVGDYKVPYTISYKNASAVKKGTVGVRISAKPEITYTFSSESPIIGTQGKVTIQVLNKGLGEARFVVVRLNSESNTIISENEVYIGSINSDDFETATFDVIFKSKEQITGVIEYRDIDNARYTLPLDANVQIYTREQAIDQGIIKKSNAPVIVSVVVILIILWIVWRAIAKRRRARKSMQMNPSR